MNSARQWRIRKVGGAWHVNLHTCQYGLPIYVFMRRFTGHDGWRDALAYVDRTHRVNYRKEAA